MEKKITKREQRFRVEDLKQLEVIVAPVSDSSKAYFADLVDLSRQGLKIRVPICVPFGEEVRILLEAGGHVYNGIGTSRHVRSVSRGEWEVGCSLDPILDQEIMGFIVAETGKERRQHNRTLVNHKVSLQTEGNMDRLSAKVVNFSVGGFCLLVENKHEIDQRVKVMLDGNGNSEVVAAQVRWQNETDDGYLIGCNFVEANSHVALLNCVHKTKTVKRLSWIVIAAVVMAICVPALSFLFSPKNASAAKSQTVELAKKPKRSGKSLAAQLKAKKAARDAEKKANPTVSKTPVVETPVKETPVEETPDVETPDLGTIEATPIANDPFEDSTMEPWEPAEPRRKIANAPAVIVELAATPVDVTGEVSDEGIQQSSETKNSEPLTLEPVPSTTESEVEESKNLRTWTDHTGSETFKAEFVNSDGALVVLKDDQGKLITRQLQWFSRSDLLFIVEFAK